jgi:hypothetical protein
MLGNMFSICFQVFANGLENTPDRTPTHHTHHSRIVLFRKHSELADCHSAPQRSVSSTAQPATKHKVATAMHIAMYM